MTTFELYVILPMLALLLLTQSILLFIDAKKKGSFAWFWGIWGLIQFPLPTVFYILFVIIPRKKRRKRKHNEMER